MMIDDDDADDEEGWMMDDVEFIFAFYITALWSAIFTLFIGTDKNNY